MTVAVRAVVQRLGDFRVSLQLSPRDGMTKLGLRFGPAANRTLGYPEGFGQVGVRPAECA